MSWSDLLRLITEEVGSDAALRIEERARQEMGGTRLTISVTPVVTPDKINRTAPGKPREAAKRIGVHYSTVYRRLIR